MTDKVEQTLRDGIAELVRNKPDLGQIDLDQLTTGRSNGTGRAPVTRWLAVAAGLVVLVGLGAGLWFGPLNDPGPRVIVAEPANPAASLVGTTWLATQIKGQDAVIDSRGRVPRLIFDDKDVMANDTCNGIMGSYRLDGDRLTLKDLLVTTMACPDRTDVERQRTKYLDALGDATRLTLRGSTLTLFDTAGTPLLTFHAADPIAAPATNVQIRVRNDSAADLDGVRARFAGGTAVDYGTIASGQQSNYQYAGEEVFRYAPIRATVDGEDLVHGIIDYVGEIPLPPGRYTYVLTIDRGSLALRLEVDQ